jgi:hypothetical protein
MGAVEAKIVRANCQADHGWIRALRPVELCHLRAQVGVAT